MPVPGCRGLISEILSNYRQEGGMSCVHTTATIADQLFPVDRSARHRGLPSFRTPSFAMHKNIVFWFLTVFLYTIPALADVPAFMTGMKLLQACESQSDLDLMFCRGYIAGASDFWSDMSSFQALTSKIPKYCPPDNITWEQLRYIVIKHMKEQPEQLNYVADVSITKALSKFYFCK
jgi:hypothetical protein